MNNIQRCVQAEQNAEYSIVGNELNIMTLPHFLVVGRSSLQIGMIPGKVLYDEMRRKLRIPEGQVPPSAMEKGVKTGERKR
ncbi:MAG TPA: hypothetical protein VFN35_20745 [Ktedonobacteraceae bacterium]|nr:hypothetical protein [Ktedonobacteraceae bacterium]